MPPREAFDRSVFVNCPFDEDFAAVLQAMLFCLVDCGLIPRIATERLDSGEARLDKIVELIEACRYSIHDLSRLQSTQAGEFARLNMPFELGIDYGFKVAGTGSHHTKAILVMSEAQYDYQKALSDIAGWDIRQHGADYQRAIGEVWRWLNTRELADGSPSRVKRHYEDFQDWDLERLEADGWEFDDILQRGTSEFLQGMHLWVTAGRPPSYN